jgi:hypothetical protein
VGVPPEFTRTEKGWMAMRAALLLVLLGPLAALAGSPFDGTWVAQTDSIVLSKKPDVFVLDQGVFQAKTATPPFKVKADGTDQPVAGHAYYDSVAVKVASPGSVELTYKKGGKTTFVNSLSVSADGKTLTFNFRDETGTQPVTGASRSTRVAAGPKGSDPISGSWRPEKVDSISSSGLTVTFKATADGLTMSNLTGQSYDAKFDGKYYPVAGDPGQTLVALKKVNNSTIIETDKRLDKVTDVITMTVAKDGATMHVKDEDKLQGTTTTWTNKKSP